MNIIEHNLFYYPYASFTNAQLPLLKVAALWFDKLYICLLSSLRRTTWRSSLGGNFTPSDCARTAAADAQAPDAVRKQLAAFRDALIKERQRLIEQEIELHVIVG